MCGNSHIICKGLLVQVLRDGGAYSDGAKRGLILVGTKGIAVAPEFIGAQDILINYPRLAI